jgi:hypothetical protein
MRSIRHFLAAAVVLLPSLAHAQTQPPLPNVATPIYGYSSGWKPTDGSGAGLTFTGVSATFTQIGNLVFAYANLTYPATADGSNAQIAGLPLISLPGLDYAAQCTLTVGSSPNAYVVLNNTVYPFPGAIAGKTGRTLQLIGGGRIPFTNAALSTLPVSLMCIYPAS